MSPALTYFNVPKIATVQIRSSSSSDYIDEEEEEKNKLGKFNIIFTIGKDKNNDEFEDMVNEEWETLLTIDSIALVKPRRSN